MTEKTFDRQASRARKRAALQEERKRLWDKDPAMARKLREAEGTKRLMQRLHHVEPPKTLRERAGKWTTATLFYMLVAVIGLAFVFSNYLP